MDINQQNENLQPSIESNQEKDPVQAIATGLGVVSGGLAGAMIGRLVAGRFGAAVGAVVGGVAGANVGREAAEGVDQRIANVADAVKHNVKQTVDEIKSPVIDTVDAVKQNVEAAQPAVTGAIDSVRETIDETRPAMKEAIGAVTETIDETRPSMVETADAVKATVEDARPAVQEAVQKTSESIQSSASSIADSVQGTAQSVKGAAQEAQPKMTEAMEQVADNVQSSVSTMSDSIQGGIHDTASNVASSTETATSRTGSWSSDQPIADVGVFEDMQPPIEDATLIDSDTALILDQPDRIDSSQAIDQSIDQSIDQPIPIADPMLGGISDQTNTDAAQRTFDRGLMLSNQGDFTGAELAFSDVIDLMPDSPEAHFNLGIVLLQLDRKAEGIVHIREARDLSRSRGDFESADNLDRILQQVEMMS